MRDVMKPRLGQNFLTDMLAQKRVFDALGEAVTGTVVEIGPGRAALTELLAVVARRLVAIELDRDLAAALKRRFSPMPTVQIVEEDVLRCDLHAYADGPRSIAVVGNLPYYITSPILRHLFAAEPLLNRAVVMVQREVGERMAARPGSREYGLLSVLCQVHADTQLLFNLPPQAFSPPPEVHSSVLRLEFGARWEELGVQPEAFVRFAEQAFQHKRKTLANNLKAAGYSSAQAAYALEKAEASPAARAEELSVDQLALALRTLDASG